MAPNADDTSRQDDPDEPECGNCGDDFCPVCGACCHYCGGEGYGVVGCDWDSDDPINGPYDGEIEKCPCCGGTGRGKDCTFW